MGNNIFPLITGQLPEHIQESTPLFKDFIVTYYRYASQRNKSVGVIQNNTVDSDIDETTDQYISNFYATYGQYLPKEVSIDKRNFIKFLNKIYESKGTEKSLELIFRLLFNDSVAVTYPTTQVLRASGGKWNQQNYISVTTKFGINPVEGESVTFSNKTGDYEIIVSKVIRVSPSDIRIYYKSYLNVIYIDDQLVYVRDDAKNIKFIAQLIKSPIKIIVKSSGAGWQIGQIITIDGSISPTIARVTSINTIGGITGIEVLDHGYIHSENELVTVSPYPNKPSGSYINIISELTSQGVFHHSVNIEDSTKGTSEELVGVSNQKNNSSYFLEDYVLELYAGTTVIFTRLTNISNTFLINEILDTGLTMDQWLASRATLYFEIGNVVNTKGYYEDDTGKISHQQVSIQDNYFYQAFSYVMETKRDISEYIDALNITHPAGTKRFSKIIKEFYSKFSISSDRVISKDYSLFKKDIFKINDVINKKIGKSSFEFGAIKDRGISINYSTIKIDTSHTNDLITKNKNPYFKSDYVSEFYQLNN